MKTVADNKTYRNQYHFTDDFTDTAKDNPSIKGLPDINTVIKENPFRSNVEIEGGELVLQPDLSALFKANGKKHSNGGMDVLLRPNSFVFSDFKDLSITDKEKELFELKEGGSVKTSTPADVVKQNINVKHYNTLINNLSDPYKDDLAKKSSALMLEKYIATLGNIAYIQEKKKGFPDGIPQFALGTAPVYDSEVKQKVDETKQYAKYGGTISSTGGFPDLCPCGKDSKGNCLPCSSAQLQELLKKAPRGKKGDEKGMNMVGKVDNTTLYHLGTDPTSAKQKITKFMTNDEWKRYLANETPEQKAKRKAREMGNPGTDKLLAISEQLTSGPECDCGMDKLGQCIPCNEAPKINPPVPVPGSPTGDTQLGKSVDWQFTPWQKISQLYNFGQYATAKRYMPYRSRYNATYADPSLLNPEQAVGDAKGIAAQQLQALGTLNPILRNTQAAAAVGQLYNAIPGIRSQYDNQNAQIQNQFRQYNNQVRNNESLVNMSNDQTYYQQAIEGRKNFDNLRTFTANNAMNNVLRDVETNQKLAYNLLTQNNPVYSFDWRTGNFSRNNVDIRDVTTDGTSDIYSDFFKELENASTPEEIQKLQIKEKLLRQKNILPFLKNQAPGFMKKGGKTKNPYK